MPLWLVKSVPGWRATKPDPATLRAQAEEFLAAEPHLASPRQREVYRRVAARLLAHAERIEAAAPEPASAPVTLETALLCSGKPQPSSDPVPA
jgi:hypothetical protein